jgi:hypothetical protein
VGGRTSGCCSACRKSWRWAAETAEGTLPKLPLLKLTKPCAWGIRDSGRNGGWGGGGHWVELEKSAAAMAELGACFLTHATPTALPASSTQLGDSFASFESVAVNIAATTNSSSSSSSSSSAAAAAAAPHPTRRTPNQSHTIHLLLSSFNRPLTPGCYNLPALSARRWQPVHRRKACSMQRVQCSPPHA